MVKKIVMILRSKIHLSKSLSVIVPLSTSAVTQTKSTPTSMATPTKSTNNSQYVTKDLTQARKFTSITYFTSLYHDVVLTFFIFWSFKNGLFWQNAEYHLNWH